MKYFKVIICLVLFLVFNKNYAQTILRVTEGGAGNVDGSTWADALDSTAFRAALRDATSATEFWIAAGTYRPESKRDSSFRILLNGIKLYGGFSATDTSFSSRDYIKNKTILSGDIAKNDGVIPFSKITKMGNRSDNNYHVLTILPINRTIDSSTLIDGISIEGGNATSANILHVYGVSTISYFGAGIYLYAPDTNHSCSPIFRNCNIAKNSASSAALYEDAYYGLINTTLDNCHIHHNYAYSYGILNMGNRYKCIASIKNCLIDSNEADASAIVSISQRTIGIVDSCRFIGNSSFNGALYCNSSSINVSNSIFDGNYSSENGAAVYNYTYGNDGYCNISGCLFTRNYARFYGGAVYSRSGSSDPMHVSIINSTFYKNSSFLEGKTIFGSGGYNYKTDTCYIYNSIIYETNNSSNRDIIAESDVTFHLKNCMLQNMAAIIAKYDVHDKGRCSEAYPLFLDSGNINGNDGILATADDGLQLDSGSYAINNGDTSGIYNLIGQTDIIGNNRFSACTVDIGAYENKDTNMMIMIQPKNINACISDTINFYINAVGCGKISYQWRKNGVVIQGQNNQLLTFKNVQLSDTGYYDVIVKNSIQSDSLISDSIKLTVNRICNVRFVSVNGSGTKDGSFWGDAMDNATFASVLPKTNKSIQFWLAEGTYIHPAHKRDSSYTIAANGIKLYGGFAITDTSFSQRDPLNHKSIFSGDIAQNDSPGYSNLSKLYTDSSRLDNSYNILRTLDYIRADSTTIIDGFYFIGGNANYFPTYNDRVGGAIHLGVTNSKKSSNPIISNCVFRKNSAYQGGAIYFEAALNTKDLVINNCQFLDNYSYNAGGAIYLQGNYDSIFSKIDNCFFIRNRSENGGAIYISGEGTYTKVKVTSSLFYKNKGTYGGVYYVDGNSGRCRLLCTNSTFYDNNATYGDIYALTNHGIKFGINDADTADFQNCIMWQSKKDTNLNYFQYEAVFFYKNCILQSGYNNLDGTNYFDTSKIITQYPRFKDTADIDGPDEILGNADDGFNLDSGSVAINSGDTTGKSSYLPNTDIQKTARIKNCTIDIGAYETDDSTRNISIKSIDPRICIGDNIRLTADFGGCSNSNNYIWRKNGVDISGATSKYLQFNNFKSSDSANYEVIVKYNNTDSVVSSVYLYIYKNCKVNCVTVGGNGRMDGTDWSNAMSNKIFREQLQKATPNLIFWVAKGTYYPDNCIDSSFRIYAPGIQMYGGFTTSDTTLSQRNPGANQTILSGDLSKNDSAKYKYLPNLLSSSNRKDNCNHVITIIARDGTHLDSNVVIDGFIISGGNAKRYNQTPTVPVYGVGIDKDWGGGIYFYIGDHCNPTIRNCQFRNNSASDCGGAFAFKKLAGITNLTVSGCSFYSNYANVGAAISNQAFGSNICCTMYYINCTFYNNFAYTGNTYYTDGYTYSVCCKTYFLNSIIWNNGAFNANNGMSISAGTLILKNDIFQNFASNNSFLSGKIAYSNVTSSNPLFTDTVNYDLTLNSKSPAINNGDSTFLLNYYYHTNKDIFSNNRIQSCQIDIGAYETSSGFNCCEKVKIPVQANNISVCSGRDTSVFINTTGSVTGLQWEDSSANTWTKINGAIDSIYKLKNIVSTKYLRCKLKGQCDSTYSKTIKIIAVNPVTYNYNTSVCKGQTYLFKGKYLSSAGTYYDTTSSYIGCDSIIALHLYIDTATHGVITAIVCPGQNYWFNGQNVNSAGDYLDTLVNARGCDSFITLHLKVSKQIFSNLQKAICIGDFYNFNGNNIYTSGTYTDTIPSSFGCDSIITLSLNTNPISNSNVLDTICEINNYLFGGIYINKTGDYYDTLSNYLGCDSIVKLSLYARPIQKLNPITGTSSPIVGQIVNYSVNGAPNIIYHWSVNRGVIQAGQGTNKIVVKWQQTGNGYVNVTGECSDTGLLKTNIYNSISLPEVDKIDIFPNPTNGEIKIQTNNILSNATLKLYNISGQLILQKSNLNGENFILDISEKASGIYYLEIMQDAYLSRVKVVKQ